VRDLCNISRCGGGWRARVLTAVGEAIAAAAKMVARTIESFIFLELFEWILERGTDWWERVWSWSGRERREI
jgi:hypothetical protein